MKADEWQGNGKARRGAEKHGKATAGQGEDTIGTALAE